MRVLAAVALVVGLAGSAAAQTSVAIPTAEAFAQPAALSSAELSPNGQWVAGIRLLEGGEALIVTDWRTGQAFALQSARYADGLEIGWVAWKSDNRLIFGVQQWCNRLGDPITLAQMRAAPDRAYRIVRVFAINRDASGMKQLLLGEMGRLAFGASTYLVDTLARDPGHILLGSYSYEAEFVFRVDVSTGAAEVAARYPGGRTSGWMSDGAGIPVMRREELPGASGYRIFRRRNDNYDWIKVIEVRSAPDSNVPDFQFVAPGPAANQVYVIARPEDRDTAALYLYDTAAGTLGEPLVSDARADFVDAIMHPTARTLLLACVEDRRRRCVTEDATFAADWSGVATQMGRDQRASIVGMSADASIWLVHAEGPRNPGAYHVFDRSARALRKFVDLRPNLAGAPFAPTSIVDYAARDGARLWAYYTAPATPGAKPLIVMPHGGPEARDTYGFDLWAQYFAAHGYAVLQPNFRGGSGFGRAFAVAGHGQWGKRMQDDVADAVRHVVASGQADPARICIVGASYGGYAALAAAVLEPDVYKCVIGVNGVYDLPDMLQSERREEGRSSQTYGYWTISIGDPRTDSAALATASPARRASEIKAPVLLIAGVEDQIVPFAQSQRMERALRDAGKAVVLVRYESEDHSPFAWERRNLASFLSETLKFVDSHIGDSPSPR